MVYVSKNVLLCCWSFGHFMNCALIGYVPKKGLCFSADIRPSGHRKFHVGAGDKNLVLAGAKW
jgi:hypothetical protein